MTDATSLLRIAITICDAPFHAIVDADTVVFATFGTLTGEQTSLPSVADHPVAEALTRYAEGQVCALNGIAVRQPGTPFRVQVWDALRSIKPGTPISYSELAARANHPSAVRAAASSCAINQIPLIVPCHRALRRDGTLGGYAFGLSLKARLLAHEAPHTD